MKNRINRQSLGRPKHELSATKLTVFERTIKPLPKEELSDIESSSSVSKRPERV